MSIHPTALIDPAAEIADDAEIGPHACIDGPVKIGSGSVIHSQAVLTGNVRMGRNNIVGHRCIIGAEPQDRSFNSRTNSEVIIGNNNIIREYCTIHRGATEGSATRVGNDNYFMVGVHLAHNTTIGNHVTMANNVLLAGHVEVQDDAFIGGGSVFHQHVRVGKLALTQGKSGVTKDIPPYTILTLNYIVGVNFSGLRRAGFTAEQRAEIKSAFGIVYRNGLNTKQALDRAREMKWSSKGRYFFDFIKSANKRGICDLRAKQVLQWAGMEWSSTI